MKSSPRATIPRELLWNLTLRELRGKYKRSFLGWGWSLLNPIVFLGIYSFVFTVLFKQTAPVGNPSGIQVYPLFLVCGLLPWTYHSNCINGAVQSLSMNVNLIRKVYFPRSILPVSAVFSWLITFGIELLVLVSAFLITGHMVLQWIPMVICVALLQTGFSLGIGLVATSLNAFYRDVEYLTNIVLQLWFWATPVVWPPTLLLDRNPAPTVFGIKLITILQLNPMYEFVEAYRNLLYDQTVPDLKRWVIMFVSAVLSVGLGALVFRKVEPRLAEEL